MPGVEANLADSLNAFTVGGRAQPLEVRDLAGHLLAVAHFGLVAVGIGDVL